MCACALRVILGGQLIVGGGGVRGVGAEGSLQTSRWSNSGCCGCDWDGRLGCVDFLRSGCFGRAGGQLRAASCQ